jgi:hypothetical protein
MALRAGDEATRRRHDANPVERGTAIVSRVSVRCSLSFAFPVFQQQRHYAAERQTKGRRLVASSCRRPARSATAVGRHGRGSEHRPLSTRLHESALGTT